jgi:hypothetical protein
MQPSDVVLYTTREFSLSQQIKTLPSMDGFLGDGIGGGEAIEDPFWTGTHTASNTDEGIPLVAPSSRVSLKRSASEGDGFVGM